MAAAASSEIQGVRNRMNMMREQFETLEERAVTSEKLVAELSQTLEKTEQERDHLLRYFSNSNPFYFKNFKNQLT